MMTIDHSNIPIWRKFFSSWQCFASAHDMAMLFCNQGCLIELRKILWTLLLYARVPVTWGPLSGVERRGGMLSINLLGGKIWFKNPHRTSYIVYFYFSLAGEAVALLGFKHCMAHTFVLADYVSSLLHFVSCIWGIWCIAQFSLQGAFFNVNLEMNRQPTQWTPGAVFRFKCFPRAFSQSHLLRSGICAGFLFTEWHRPKQTKDVIDTTGKWKPKKEHAGPMEDGPRGRCWLAYDECLGSDLRRRMMPVRICQVLIAPMAMCEAKPFDPTTHRTWQPSWFCLCCCTCFSHFRLL